jgi:hypothetical protein
MSREVNDTDVDYQQKLNILNQFVSDYDLYEKSALGSENEWRHLAQYNSFSDALRIPEDVHLPPSEGVLGNGEPVPPNIYRECTRSLKDEHYVKPTIFAEYNAAYSGSSYGVTSTGIHPAREPFQCFVIPWGEVCLYAHLSDDMIYLPVYPEGFDDGTTGNYEEMPEMLYQYEPWKVYKSSGPRELSFTFEFHRDMWTGDHRDGRANSVIRRCEANCYPDYNGSLINVPIVTLYIHGQNFITGVMTSCKTSWDKPIGLDGFYLMCKLSFSITEVSPVALNYEVVRNKGLIS